MQTRGGGLAGTSRTRNLCWQSRSSLWHGSRAQAARQHILRSNFINPLDQILQIPLFKILQIPLFGQRGATRRYTSVTA